MNQIKKSKRNRPKRNCNVHADKEKRLGTARRLKGYLKPRRDQYYQNSG